MGPQHPSTHGVLRLVLELDGELIQSSDSPTIGYLHTGIEKTAEQKKWQQVIPPRRAHGLPGRAVEQSGLRVVRGETAGTRDAAAGQGTSGCSSLSCSGCPVTSSGSERIRWKSVPCRCSFTRSASGSCCSISTSCIAGFRFFPSYIRIGGLREDLPRGFHEAVNAFLDRFPAKLDEYEGLLTKNDIFLRRTEDVGVVSEEDALAWGLVGPIARAAGSDYDVRTYFPYTGYETYEFDVPTAKEGDAFARYRVRMQEMRESVKICRQAIDRITPFGAWACDDTRVVPPPKDKVYTEMEALIQHFLIYSQGFTVPAGDAYVPVEGPRGEHGTYVVSDGTNRPWRVKMRAPSFMAIQALPTLVQGGLIADVVAVIGSNDVVMGDCDR